MLDDQSCAARPRRRLTAAAASAALVGALLAPALGGGPAAATATCQAILPFGASASGDLLRLDALDLRPLGLGLGPVADVSIATTGAGMAADAEVASAAAARDVAANLLGLDALGLVPVGQLGTTAFQQAPPAHTQPVSHTGLAVDLGLARANIGTVEAHATWDEGMRCGGVTGTTSQSSASLLDAAILPGRGDRALVRLPQNLSSRAETGLISRHGRTASRAEAAASLTHVQLFAGTRSEINIRVVSEPELKVVATGSAGSSTVSYQAPVVEISGPNIPTERLELPGQHLDLALPGVATGGTVQALTGTLPLVGDLPLEGLLADLTGGLLAETAPLTGLTSGAATTERPLELANLPGVAEGGLPLLREVLGGQLIESLVPGLGSVSLLRLSTGALQQDISDDLVTASAASLRLQVLSWHGDSLNAQARGEAVIDLGIGLLEAAATAPTPPATDPESEQAPPGNPAEPGEPEGTGGGCADCDDGKLPVTGSTLGIVVGAGVLLATAGRFLLLVSRRGWLTAG